jgi:hypothetical protein
VNVSAAQLLEQTILRLQQGWTKGACARDAAGTVVDASSEEACSWCVSGAMDLIGKGFTPSARNRARKAVWFAIGKKSKVGAVADFNDTHSLEEVIETLKKAVARATDLDARGRRICRPQRPLHSP